jgi:hypothetical protein
MNITTQRLLIFIQRVSVQSRSVAQRQVLVNQFPDLSVINLAT